MIPNNNADFKTKKTLYKNDSTLYYFYRIVLRMSVFFFLVLLSLLIFYFVGNYQEFLDSSQKLILNLAAIVSVVNTVFSILSLALNIATFLMVKRKVYRFVLYTLLYVLMLAISTGTFFVSRTILLLANGL